MLRKKNWSEYIQQVAHIRKELPLLVWQSAGICRTETILKSAIERVKKWQSQLASLPLSKYILKLAPNHQINFNSPQTEAELRLYAETLNLLDIAYLILSSAIFRTESRGGHYRLDYPHTSPDWQVHTTVQNHHWSTINLI